MHSFGPLRHLDLWSVAAFETNGSSGGGSSSRSRSYAAVDAQQPRGSANLQNKNTAGQTFKMDLGLAPKNERYYADLPDRQARSRAAAEAASSNNSDDGPGLSSAASRAAPTAASSAAGTSTAAVDPAVQQQMGSVQEAAGAVTSGVGGATSGGTEADVQVDEIAKKGRSSTILTDPRGLIGAKGDEDKTRRRRSLIGG